MNRPAYLFGACLLIAGCGKDAAPSQPDGGFGPARERVFVSASGRGEVHVFDLERLEPVTVVDVGAGPGEAHALADGSLVWVVSRTAGTVSFIDSEQLGVVHEVAVGAAPVHSFLSPDGAELWVGNDGSADVSIIDLQGFGERRVLTGEGHHKMAFALDETGALAFGYVSNIIDGTISVVPEGATSALRQVGDATGVSSGPGPSPHGMDYSFVTRKVYNCSGDEAHSIEVIATTGDDAHAIVERIALPSRCTYLHVAEDGEHAFATLAGADRIARVRLSDGHVDTFETGASPDKLERDGDLVYVAHVGEPTVGVVSLDGAPLRTLPVGNAVDPDGDGSGHRGLRLYGGRLFVPNAFDDTVTVIDVATEAVLTTWSGIDAPSGIAVAGPEGGTPYPR
jgi:YVTN family beta-propeller protein